MAARGKKLSDVYVELRADDSKLSPDVKVKAARVGREFGGALNKQLRALSLDGIDLKANPADALFAIAATSERLQEMRDDAESVELRIKANKALGELERLRKRIGDVGGDAGPDAAVGFAARFGARVGPLMASLPLSGPLGTAVAAAGVAAAPLLGAALAGGIIGGVGIGGVVGGLTVATRDTRVKTEIAGLGDQLEGRLESAASAFVGPALRGVDDFKQALAKVDIEGIFASTSRYVDDLFGGVNSAIVDLSAGIAALAQNAGPVVRAISDGIAAIGESVGNGLQSLADNGAGAADALSTLFGIITVGLNSTFMLVNTLTELYELNKKIGGDYGLQLLLKATGAAMDDTAESARRTSGGTFGMADGFQKAKDKSEELKEAQEALKPVQDAVKASQDALNRTLDSLGGKTTVAAQNASALKTAMDNLYGASIAQTEANEGYQASFDSLSETVKANSGEFKNNRNNLDLHTKAGRSNRDALQELLVKSGELYIADINAGVAIDEARKRHEKRTKAVRDEADKVGLNKRETDKLIKTYGNIPAKKTTELVLDGVRAVVAALNRMYIQQRALATGKSIAAVENEIRKGSDAGPSKGGGYAAGGYYSGMLPGPPSRVDNLLGRGPHGDVFGLAGGEFIVNPRQTAKHRPVLEAINSGLDGYADGGYYAVDRSRKWPFTVDVSGTHIMSKAEALSKVFQAGPSGAATGAWMKQLLERVFRVGMISGPRPGARTLSGNPSYHGKTPYRAVDFPPIKAMARYMFENYLPRLKEAITPWQEYNAHNGRPRRWSGAVWRQHNFAGGNAHNHFAMDRGGYVMPGWNPPIYNGTGRPEPVTTAQSMDDVIARLDRLIGAVQQVAADLGEVLTGAVRATRMAGRAA